MRENGEQVITIAYANNWLFCCCMQMVAEFLVVDKTRCGYSS